MAAVTVLGSKTGTGTSLTVTASSSSQYLDDYALVVVYNSAGGTFALADSNGSNYKCIRTGTNYQVWANTGSTNLFTSGTSTLTMTCGTSGTLGVWWLDASGVNVDQIDQFAQGSIAAAGTLTVSTAARASSIVLAVGIFFGGTVSTAPASPWSVAGSLSGTSPAPGVFYQWIQADATSVVSVSAATTGSALSGVLLTLPTLIRQSGYGLPTQPAGTAIKSSDMNTLALAASYIMRPDMVQVEAHSSQSFSANAAAAVNWTVATKDTMGSWYLAYPPYVGISVQGYYNVRYSVPYLQAASNLQACVTILFGANNPLTGNLAVWPSSSIALSSGSQVAACNGGGDIPFELFPGDTVQLTIFGTTASSTYATAPQFPRMTVRWVSA